MPVVASMVVATAIAGGVQMDADAQGRAVLGWTRWGKRAQLVQVADAVGGRLVGRRHTLRSGRATLEDLDVAASGAAVACWRDSPSRNSNRWRYRVALRAAGGTWSRPRLVTEARKVDDFSCGVSDAGAAVVSWAEGGFRTVRAAGIAADGTAERPITLARHGRLYPNDVEVAPNGSAAIIYLRDNDQTGGTVGLAQRPATGTWVKRSLGRRHSAQVAFDGASRPILAWREADGSLRAGIGPEFEPLAATTHGDTALASLAVGPRGDIVLLWTTEASLPGAPVPPRPRPSSLGASIVRPGAPFGPGTILGPTDATPRTAALAADGSGAAGWYATSSVALRKLTADGVWLPPVDLTTTMHGELFLAAASGGAVTAVWNELRPDGREVLKIAGV